MCGLNRKVNLGFWDSRGGLESWDIIPFEIGILVIRCEIGMHGIFFWYVGFLWCPFVLFFCHFSFEGVENLRQHQSDEHPDSVKYKCVLCSKQLKTWEQLKVSDSLLDCGNFKYKHVLGHPRLLSNDET